MSENQPKPAASQDSLWADLRRLTAARIGLERSGASLATAPLLGFKLDHDNRPNDRMRVVQMTRPGSACSVVIGEGLPLGEPGELAPVPARPCRGGP